MDRVSHMCPTLGTDVSHLRDRYVPSCSPSASGLDGFEKAHDLVPHLTSTLVVDAGTAFEMGFAKALGMAVFSYGDGLGPYNGRVPVGSFDDGLPARDVDGLLIEEFGLQDNLMVALSCDDGMTHPSLAAALDAAAATVRR